MGSAESTKKNILINSKDYELIKKEVSNINPTLEELFHSKCDDKNNMNEFTFFSLFKMPQIKELEEQFKRLFFHKAKKRSAYKISFTQFRYFYYLFLKGEEIFDIKIKFLAELFFGQEKNIDPLIFHNNLILYCPKIDDVKFFYTKEFQQNCMDKKKDTFSKSNFIKYLLEQKLSKPDYYEEGFERTDTDLININNNSSLIEWKFNEYNEYNMQFEKNKTKKHRPSLSTVSKISKFIPSLPEIQFHINKIDEIQTNKEGHITHLNFPSEISEESIQNYLNLIKQENELKLSLKNTDKKMLSCMYFHFLNLFRVKQIKFMSKVSSYFNEKYVYVCDCSNCNGNKTCNKLGERTATEAELAEMETEYKEYEKKTKNKKIHVKDLKELLKEFKVCDKFSDIIGKYLEKEYQSTVVEFKAFKSLLSMFRGAINEDTKKQILFFLYVKKNSTIKLTTIKDLFTIEDYDKIEKENNKEITLQDFSKINADYFVEDLLNSYDKINLIPFLKFNIIPKERAQIRECFNFFGVDFSNYVEQLNKWCSAYNSFNVVPTSFINSLLDYINLDINSVIRPNIIYDQIAKRHKNNNITLKLSCLNQNDFYILPSRIFYYMNNWFGSRNTSIEISLKKIQLKEDSLPTEEQLNKIGYLYKKEKSTYLIQYSSIFCKLITFNEIVENIRKKRKEKGIDDNNVDIASLYEEVNRMLIEFRSPKSLLNKDNEKDDDNQLKMICEIDWNFNENKIREKFYPIIVPVIQKEMSTLRLIHNIKDPKLSKEASLKSMKFYYFVHDEIKELKDLIKGNMINDDIIPFTDIIILVDYKKPLPISKEYTYDLIQKDETKERLISFSSQNSFITNSLLGEPSSMMSSGIFSPDFYNNPDISIINPIISEDNQTILTLANIGNSCYINVILQFFLNSPIIKKVIFDKKQKISEVAKKLNNNQETVIDILLKMLDKKWNSKKIRAVMPKYLLEEFRNKCVNVNKNIVCVNKEGDANEFFMFLLETLSSELKFNNIKSFHFNSDINDGSKSNDSEFCNRVSNLHYANYISNEASYILPIFAFQTKKILKCEKCSTQKVQFEIYHDLFLSVESNKIITLNICLNRLPFCYKVYYDSLSKEFDYFNSSIQPDKPFIYNLISYYFTKIKKGESEIFIDDYLGIEFSVNVDKTKTIGWLIDFIRNIDVLELEKNNNENEEIEKEQIGDNDIFKKKEEKLTSFLVWGWNKSPQCYLPEMTIQSCFEDEARVFIEEILNINGIRKVKESYLINGIDDDFVSFSYFTPDEKGIPKHEGFNISKEYINEENNLISNLNKSDIIDNNEHQKENKEEQNIIENEQNDNPINIDEEYKKNAEEDDNNENNKGFMNGLNPKDFAINNKPLYTFSLSHSVLKGYDIIKSSSLFTNETNNVFSFDSLFTRDTQKFIQDIDYFSKKSRTYEYMIEIVHCYQYQLKHYFFEPFQKFKIQFKPSYLIFSSNNNDSITPIMLYDYIWEKYRKYLQTIKDIKKENLWWLRSNKHLIDNEKYRFCYPFCIKIIKAEDKDKPHTSCAYCYWYQFCSGCILDPFNVEPINMNPHFVIEVEWCNEIVDLCYRKTNVICSLKCLLSENEGKWNLTTVKDNSEDTKNIYVKDVLEQKQEETLDYLIQYNMQDEILNDYQCPNCQGKEYVSQEIIIHKAPELLVINFMRFKYESEGKKITTLIKYPIEGLIIKEGFTNQNIDYNLYCIINHIGQFESGHYNCIIKSNESKWIKYSDLICEEITNSEDLITSNAYILIYSRNSSQIENNSVKKLIDYLIENENNFNEKKFLKNEPVINNNKLAYFIKEIENGMGQIGDVEGIYEVELNNLQRCLVIEDIKNKEKISNRKQSKKIKSREDKLAHNKQRTYSMFENNIEDTKQLLDERCVLF